MAILKKLFGPRNSLDQARKLFRQGEYVRFLQYVDLHQIGDPEVPPMIEKAREILKERNLEEARMRLCQGDTQAARESLELAAEFGAGAEELSAVKRDVTVVESDSAPVANDCNSCSTGQAFGENPVASYDENLEQQDALELLLAGMPENIADRYREKSAIFIQALLASGQGEDENSLSLLRSCPDSDRDALYDFELAAALCRCGQVSDGIQTLERCLNAMPVFPAAWELATDLALQGAVIDRLDARLAELADNGKLAGYADFLLCRLAWNRGDRVEALQRGERCLAFGMNEPETIQIVALCLEKMGNLDRAEALLSGLPTSGCGGGAHPLLAEFWLRQNKHLDKALESFKAMARQDRENPLWPLRIAETYLAKGWGREALKVVSALESASDLPDSIRSALAEIRRRVN